MEALVAGAENLKFDVEIALEQQIGAQLLPFPGMDKSGSGICTFHLRNVCIRGGQCPFRHTSGLRTVVCKHWLRGLCKKGDDCEFLHEYDMSRMPECYFFSRFGECANKECPFIHTDPTKKRKECPWYARGFCRHGPACKNRHVRRVLCLCWLTGLCPDGPECKFAHPRWELPVTPSQDFILPNPNVETSKQSSTNPVAEYGYARPPGVPICHFCRQLGHKIYECPTVDLDTLAKYNQEKFEKLQAKKVAVESRSRFPTPSFRPPNPHVPRFRGLRLNYPLTTDNSSSEPGKRSHTGSGLAGAPDGKTFQPRGQRPIDEVVCFKCGEKGHYANRCDKGHLAFLTPSSIETPFSTSQSNADVPMHSVNIEDKK